MGMTTLLSPRKWALRMRPGVLICFVFFLSTFLFATSSFALIDLTIFGPKRFDRLKGKPTVYTETFGRCNPATQGLLKVTNGDGKKTRIKSARVYVNGHKVAKESDFKQKSSIFEKSISIKEQNELKVVLKSGRHGYFEKLAKYQGKQAEVEQELARLQKLREELADLSPLSSGERARVRGASAAKLEDVLKELRSIKKGMEDEAVHLGGMSGSLDDDAEDDEGEESGSDDEDELDSGWLGLPFTLK